MREAMDWAWDPARMGTILKTRERLKIWEGPGLGLGDCQDGPYTEDWGETGHMRKAGDWTRKTARMGPILTSGVRLEI